jgi:phosphoribosylamine--glycine ligase
VIVLVVGSGGREHALAWSLARSDEVETLFAAPGNPGMESVATCVPAAAEPAAIAQAADDLDVDLVVVGPEAPLVAGAVDAVEARGRTAFGPRAAAARLEGSKAWMKEVAAAAGVPTARHATFTAGEQDAADEFLDTLPGLYVVKTDGLAAGKGVVVTESLADARTAVRDYLSGAAFGDAGRTLVIEEGLRGPEMSLLVLCDGTDTAALPPAQDFKRVGDGDAGPNTGGMGAYSPVPVAGPAVVEEAMHKIVEPVLGELRRRGIEYRGVLYAGLMLTAEGAKLIEFNVRFGDPECQVVVPRLAGDLARLCFESATGALRSPVDVSTDAAVCVVLAADGYPASPRAGDPITGLDAAGAVEGVTVFHAGTRRDGDRIVTAGGRVLGITGTGPSIAAARDRAYEAADHVSWPGIQLRRDIAAVAAGQA